MFSSFPGDIVRGLYRIVTDPVVSDYLEIGGIAATFINAGLGYNLHCNSHEAGHEAQWLDISCAFLRVRVWLFWKEPAEYMADTDGSLYVLEEKVFFVTT